MTSLLAAALFLLGLQNPGLPQNSHRTENSLFSTGAMSEVYQATDTKLSVAIKVLPVAFAHDAERAARFERETRVLASLSHPNVAVLLDVKYSIDALRSRNIAET